MFNKKERGVLLQNASFAFYCGLHFRLIGVRKGFYNGSAFANSL